MEGKQWENTEGSYIHTDGYYEESLPFLMKKTINLQ